MREVLRGSRLLRALRFLPYRVSYAVASALTPMRRDRILFLSDSHADFDGNMAFVRDGLIARYPGADIRAVFKSSLGSRRPLVDALRLPILLATSRVVVVDDFYPLIYPIRLRRGTRLVQVWHAAGAFKRVGHSRAGLPGGPTPGSDIHRNYTDAYVSSEGIRSHYAEAFGIDLARVRALGVPRTDFFHDMAAVSSARARVRSRLGIAPDHRLVLFAPTFRGNGQLSAHTGESADWSQVARELGGGWQVAIRNHPFATRAGATVPVGLIDASGIEDMNELLAAADVLVTDYSSAIFEYALLRRPIVFFTPDLEDYATTRAFYRPFAEYAIGPTTESEAELARLITHARVDEAAYDRFLMEFCGSLDGRSTARVVDDIAHHLAGGRTARPTLIRVLKLHLVAAHAARAALSIASALMRFLPRRRKVTMLTREHNRVPLDFILLERAIRHRDPDIEVKVIARMIPPGIIPKIGYALHLLVETYHVATSRALIVDGYSIVASVARHADGLTIVQIWHALGSLKKFGRSILGRQEGRDPRVARALRMHENYDFVLTSAEACRGPYAEAFGVDQSQVLVAPLPRVDYLRDPEARARARARFAKAHPEASRPIALFAPTFRAHGTPPGIDPVHLTRALAGIGYTTVTKLHPILGEMDHPELTVAIGMSTQDLLHVADVFITDYSSAVFEAAVASVPSYLLAPDLDQYSVSRDFYVDYQTALGLPFARTIDELVRSVENGAATEEQLNELRRRFVADSPTAAATAAADELAALAEGWSTSRIGEPT
ncbi:CDP-glycerol glycerophosphotransferase family protein [Microbacterium sp.]|uniref:CDP-glycerol glycerophosphotransferase family protein n=1 Tax=Microbacterium sp. TaxID=51671 RepID=UPI0039C9598E